MPILSLLLPHCELKHFFAAQKVWVSVRFLLSNFCTAEKTHHDVLQSAKPFCKVFRLKCLPCKIFLEFKPPFFITVMRLVFWDCSAKPCYICPLLYRATCNFFTNFQQLCRGRKQQRGPVQISSTNNDALCDASLKHLIDKSTISGSTNLQKVSRNRIELCIKYGLEKQR